MGAESRHSFPFRLTPFRESAGMTLLEGGFDR